MTEQIVVEPDRKRVGIVDAAAGRLAILTETEFGLQALLGIAQRKRCLNSASAARPLQAVIGRQHRAARDAGEEVDAVEQRDRARSGSAAASARSP